MQITGYNLIAGAESADGTATFTSVDPRTRAPGSVQFRDATPTEIDHAVQAAQEAYRALRNYSAEKLAAFLDICAAEIDALKDVLVRTADYETGLGETRLTGELARTTGQLRKFAVVLREGSYVDAIIDPALPDRQPLPRADIRRMLFPIGPVAVFSASNFPFAFATAGGDTASAFAAGCPVIVKGHPGHPATSELFARALNAAVAKAGFPPGTFSLIQGTGVDVGQALVMHPGVAAVAFTGSLRGGRAIYDTAATRPVPIPVYAEMGSVNPLVVLPEALKARGESVADALVASVTLGTGQFCTNPGLVFLIQSPETDGFIDAVVAQMKQQAPGILLNKRIEDGLRAAVAETVSRGGVDQLTGGAVADADAPFCYGNTVLRTTGAAFRAEPELQQEHFGPVTLLVVCESLDDLMLTLAVVEGNLTGTIHADAGDKTMAARVADRLREKVGRLIWNGVPTGVEVGYAMQHGGPYPATTAPSTTSVGMTALRRFMRPVAFQDVPADLLPPALQDGNPLGIWRLVDGALTRDVIG